MRSVTSGHSAIQLVERIDEIAAEIMSQENQLRDFLICMLKNGKLKQAIAVLTDWQSMAPSEVLKKYSTERNDEA